LGSFIASQPASQPGVRFHPGLVFSLASRAKLEPGLAGCFSRVARLRSDGATERRAIHETKHEALRDEHGIPAGLLPIDGRHPHRLEMRRAT
jgi:hypothetical protein